MIIFDFLFTISPISFVISISDSRCVWECSLSWDFTLEKNKLKSTSTLWWSGGWLHCRDHVLYVCRFVLIFFIIVTAVSKICLLVSIALLVRIVSFGSPYTFSVQSLVVFKRITKNLNYFCPFQLPRRTSGFSLQTIIF